MRRYIKLEKKDKEFVKMINHKETNFELVFLSDEMLAQTLQFINNAEGENICIAWQTKFNLQNFVVYNDCKFSTPMNYSFDKYLGGWRSERKQITCQKVKVTCSNLTYFTFNEEYKNKPIIFNPWAKCNRKFKDGKILGRRLKINEINIKNSNDGK